MSTSGYFVTLTYSEENLPQNHSLLKSDLQLFFKRLRRPLSQKIKYFAVGEYGDKFNRPHYHAIIFNLNYLDLEHLENSWHLGLVHIGTCTPESIQYTTGYIQKKLLGKTDFYTSQGIIPPFQLQSQGLGLSYALKHKKLLSSTLHHIYKSKKVSLPRYYIEKLEIDKTLLQSRAIEYNEKARLKILSISHKFQKSWLKERHFRDISLTDYVLEFIYKNKDNHLKALDLIKQINKDS